MTRQRPAGGPAGRVGNRVEAASRNPFPGGAGGVRH